MENLMELLPYFATAIAGQLVHILAKLSKLEKRKGFSLKTWIGKNGFTTLLGIVSAIIGVLVIEDVTFTTALTGGYVIDSLLKNGKNAVSKK